MIFFSSLNLLRMESTLTWQFDKKLVPNLAHSSAFSSVVPHTISWSVTFCTPCQVPFRPVTEAR